MPWKRLVKLLVTKTYRKAILYSRNCYSSVKAVRPTAACLYWITVARAVRIKAWKEIVPARKQLRLEAMYTISKSRLYDI